MPRLKNLPSLDIIHGFRGILDFYMWRGLACVRKWPVNPRSHHSEATKAAAATFGDVSKAWSLIGTEILAAYQEDAKDQPRSSRDIYFAAVYGHLHEVAMPDYTALLTQCRDSLALIDDLIGALESVDTDDLLVKITDSVLPTGAATQATLATLATDAKLELVRLLLLSLDGKDFATQTTLAALLAELALKADLTETQPVSVSTLPLPSGAATQTTLATLATEAKLELVRLLLVSLDGKGFATQTTLAALLTELALKADLTETQPVSAAALPLPSGAATEDKQDDIIAALGDVADTPTIYNLTLTNADTEYSQALPANTRKLLVKCRGLYDLKLAYATGESGSLYITIPPNTVYSDDFIAPAALTVYIQCPTNAQVAEILAWA